MMILIIAIIRINYLRFSEYRNGTQSQKRKAIIEGYGLGLSRIVLAGNYFGKKVSISYKLMSIVVRSEIVRWV